GSRLMGGYWNFTCCRKKTSSYTDWLPCVLKCRRAICIGRHESSQTLVPGERNIREYVSVVGWCVHCLTVRLSTRPLSSRNAASQRLAGGHTHRGFIVGAYNTVDSPAAAEARIGAGHSSA